VYGALSPHFVSFYSLFDDPDEMLIPVYVSDVVAPTSSHSGIEVLSSRNMLGDPFSCVHCRGTIKGA
jgi:hypothetical protein